MTCHTDPVPFWCPLDPALGVALGASFGDVPVDDYGLESGLQ